MEVQRIVQNMTLEDKIALCTGSDFWHTKSMPQYGIPSITMADGPHGLRCQAETADMLGINDSLPATCFPTAVTAGATWNRTLYAQEGEAIGKEGAAAGVSVVLGPGCNIKRNPLGGRNFEYISEDPYFAGKMAAAFIRGQQQTGVFSSLKHFAVNSQEYQRQNGDSQLDERTFRETYLTPFEIAVKEGKPGTEPPTFTAPPPSNLQFLTVTPARSITESAWLEVMEKPVVSLIATFLPSTLP